MEKRLLTIFRSTSEYSSSSAATSTDNCTPLDLLLRYPNEAVLKSKGMGFKTRAGSSGDILSTRTTEDAISRFSLDLLRERGRSRDDEMIAQKAQRLWTEMVQYLFTQLVPCNGQGNIGGVQYTSQCFFGYELISLLNVYVEKQLMSTSGDSDQKVKQLCSKLLATRVIKDARKSYSTDFRETRLYRFPSCSSQSIKGSLRSISQCSSDQERCSAVLLPVAEPSAKGRTLGTTIQSLASTVRSWKRQRSTYAGESPRITGTTGMTSSSPPPSQTKNLKLDKHSPSFKGYRYHMFSPKGYPPVKIPLRTKHSKPPLPPTQGSRKRVTFNTSGEQQDSTGLQRIASCSTLTAVVMDKSPSHSSGSNHKWVVYGYI